MDELMLKVSNVSKQYKLGEYGGTTLREELQRWSARIKGKEDPNRKIGSKDYVRGEKFLALDNISFEVKRGERVGIIGHNGAGKSTLLKLISRITAPTTGYIGLNGRVASMLEVGTGFHPELTGRENIYMNGAILGMTRKEIDAKMEDIIEFSEVRQFIDTPVKRYSSGMYVKLAFAVAAHLDSEIMIMDEVLAVGDMAFQQKCLNKMREVSMQDNRTILYVSHNMNTIKQLCDRCIVLDHGHLIYSGDVAKAIDIYLGKESDEDYPVRYNYADKERALKMFGAEAKFDSISVSKKQQAIFNVGEKPILDFIIQSKKTLESMRIVIKVYDGDDYCIGISLSEEFNLDIGENKVELTVPLNKIAQNHYVLDFLLVKCDEYGNYYAVDDPEAQVLMRFVNEYGHGIRWNRDYFGTVFFGIATRT